MSELDGVCHEKHEPINIDADVRDRLHRFLTYEAPKGMGYTAFIEWALREANYALTPCEIDGYGVCDVHGATIDGGDPYDPEVRCTAFGIQYP